MLELGNLLGLDFLFMLDFLGLFLVLYLFGLFFMLDLFRLFLMLDFLGLFLVFDLFRLFLMLELLGLFLVLEFLDLFLFDELLGGLKFLLKRFGRLLGLGSSGLVRHCILHFPPSVLRVDGMPDETMD